jgi:hypothetical protein
MKILKTANYEKLAYDGGFGKSQYEVENPDDTDVCENCGDHLQGRSTCPKCSTRYDSPQD